MKKQFKIYHGDCLDILKTKPECSIDAIVTDPPYGLNFMGKEWDHGIPGKKFWKEALRVAKPGAFLLAFGGTRTYHRLACAIEDAGWEIKDCIMWIYSTGFPKSLDIGKAIDKKLGNKREDSNYYVAPDGKFRDFRNHKLNAEIRNKETNYGYKTSGYIPKTKGNSKFEGMGTSLKPSYEPIILARKPVIGTIVDNILKYGTGGINIDKCRVGNEKRTNSGMSSLGVMHDDNWKPKKIENTVIGRFPANLIHDGSKEVLELFPNAESGKSNGNAEVGKQGDNIPFRRGTITPRFDSGSAARFFYCAKTSQKDREKGNEHVTVKPTDLMRYLVKLVTPPDGKVLDMFMGSGSTGKAAILEGFKFIGIEKEEQSFLTAQKRLEKAVEKQSLRLFK